MIFQYYVFRFWCLTVLTKKGVKPWAETVSTVTEPYTSSMQQVLPL